VTEQPLLRTPLYDLHVERGARMVPFAGYDMPVQYDSIIAEIRAVREGVGIFDVSHMGRFFIDGGDARALLDWVHTANINEEMPVGRARYGLICKRDGGIIDDGIVYRMSEDVYMLVANAGNATKVLHWLNYWSDEQFPGARVSDSTNHISMIAVQGPKAIELVSSISEFNQDEIKSFRITRCLVDERPSLVARTGYTGEDGVEIMPHAGDSSRVWKKLITAGAVPCGLGARDILRLEAGLLLHGSDMDETVNPIEAGLERFGAMDTDMCGKDAMKSVIEQGAQRHLVGFRTVERGPVPRSHSPILIGTIPIGEVASGAFSPTLDMNIGLGYVPNRFAVPGTALKLEVRGKPLDALVVPLPFYSRLRR
jgi:aminomethyltransferase